MTDKTVLRAEIDILYAASNRLTQASTPSEQLEAVSDYARSQGASSGILLYIDNDSAGQPEWLTVVAEWTTEDGVPMGIDQTFYMPSFAFNQVWLSAPGRPTLVQDALSSDLVDRSSRANYTRFQVRGIAMLPLDIKGRWVGLLMFAWKEPHAFDERDQRIYNALIQQAAPVIDSVRLFEQTQKRAIELEAAKKEMEILYAASNRLTQALTPDEWLDAVSDYARDRNAVAGVLFYVDSAELGAPVQPSAVVVAAEWRRDAHAADGLGKRFEIPDGDSFIRRWLSTPDRPTLIDDVFVGNYNDPTAVEVYQHYKMHAAAILPLNSKGRWVGMLVFAWDTPVIFDARDRRIYTAILQQATPVIDAVRLFEQTRERASRAELLLEVNAALSEAVVEEDFVGAVALYAQRHRPELITLIYIDTDGDNDVTGMRHVARWEHGVARRLNAEEQRVASMARAYYNVKDPNHIVTVSDVVNDPTLNHHQREAMLERGIGSCVIIPLHSGQRWQGVMVLIWSQPRTLTAEESYIYNALIQRLGAVITSRRAYAAEEEARRESELLYRASEAINAASSYAEIVNAIHQVTDQSHMIMMTLWENYSFENATYFEVVASVGDWAKPVGTVYTTSEYPIAHRIPRKGLVVMEDVANDPRIDPVSKASWLSEGTRARMGVPLTLNNRWMGTLAFFSSVPRIYTSVERRLIGGIGDLVTAAVERMRLKEQTEAARERAEILAEVSGSLSQASDEQAILASVQALVTRYGADFTHLAYVRSVDASNQPQTVEFVAIRSHSGRIVDLSYYPKTTYGVDEYPFLHTIFASPNDLLFVENMTTDPRDDASVMHELTKTTPIMASVSLPLKSGDHWVGALTFLWRTPQTFTPEVRALFAEVRPTATSVVASRLAYLAEQQARRETESRARELQTVARVSATATTRLDLHELLNNVTELTRESFNLQQVNVYLPSPDGQTLAVFVGENEDDQPVTLLEESVELSDDASLVARAARERRGLIINEPVPDERMQGPCSQMAVPMILADRLVGVLYVASSEAGRFDEADVQVMATLTDLIAVAIENARLYEKAQALAVLEERTRLARELHDSVSQALYGIGLGARTARTLLDRNPDRVAEPLDYVLGLAEAGLTEMRALIFQLRPESIENEGLISALAKQAASLQARHGINVTMETGDEPTLPVDIKQALYLVAREAMHNTVKHAKAKNVIVRITCAAPRCILEICDDGVGFDTRQTFPGHYGLHTMSERVEPFKGVCTIESAPGCGTTVRVEIPLVRR
jgi:signal transduction histidine kinase